MRYDAEHKRKTRERVLKAAAKAIRADGPHRVGVAGVMAKAGLTHGGFYAHFDSRDDLLVAAISQMFDEAHARLLLETKEREPAAALNSYIDFYLSARHRDATTGCPIAALAADLPRLTRAARKRFSDGVTRLTALLAVHIEQLNHPYPSAAASSVLSELVGALVLARAEPDPDRSNAFMESSRCALKARLDLGPAT